MTYRFLVKGRLLLRPKAENMPPALEFTPTGEAGEARCSRAMVSGRLTAFLH